MPDAAELAEERGESGRLGTVTVGFGHQAVLGVAGETAVLKNMAVVVLKNCTAGVCKHDRVLLWSQNCGCVTLCWRLNAMC
jgi:hypothetical protein